MVRKLAAMEAESHKLGDHFWALMPQIYKDRSDPTDAVNAAWVNAISAIADAHRAIGDLRQLLADKAARLPLPPPCPFVEAIEDK